MDPAPAALVDITTVEALIGLGLLLLGMGIAALFLKGGAGKAQEMAREQAREQARREAELAAHLAELKLAQTALVETQSAKQAELSGRLSQFADDTAKRDDILRRQLDERLDQVSARVGDSITRTQEQQGQHLKALAERLALIDRAQKNIEQLSGEVSGLQAVLSNKQARGAFGEKQMSDIIEAFLPPSGYTLQATLSNNSRVDCLIHLPSDQGDVAVDAKFPLEGWRALAAAESDHDRTLAARQFKRDVTNHINAIAGKYLIFGETHEVALMFLPSEAVYAELHAGFPEVVEAGFKQKVMIVSPTTFMATLHTMKAVMRDAAMREQAHVILRETTKMGEDVRRLDERVAKLQRHFQQAEDDVKQIRISTDKITRRSERMEELEQAEIESLPENVTALRPGA